jgi:oligoribonuclease
MDLEMTGLEPSKHVIVEIATLITDDDLEIIAEGPDLVVHQPEEALALMEPVVVEMHTKSGLLDAIRTSTVSLEEAGAATFDFIKSHGASRCAATRSAWTGASSTTTCPTSRTGCTTAAST